MNCRPGDLAVINKLPEKWMAIITSYQKYILMSLLGKIVRCVRVHGLNDAGDPLWEVEEPIEMPDGGVLQYIEDIVLTPIRADGLGIEEIREIENV